MKYVEFTGTSNANAIYKKKITFIHESIGNEKELWP